MKDLKGKLKLELVPPEFNQWISEVLTFGAEKYGSYTWLREKYKYTDFIGAYKRHLLAWEKGEELDKETGLSHLQHAASNILFLNYYIHGQILTKAEDDRVFAKSEVIDLTKDEDSIICFTKGCWDQRYNNCNYCEYCKQYRN